MATPTSPGRTTSSVLVRNANNQRFWTSSSTTPPRPSFTVELASVRQINVNGLGGNDTLIVDSTNGLINVANGIRFDGGTGSITRSCSRPAVLSKASDIYSVGPTAAKVRASSPSGGDTQTVFFQNLEPVLDTVPAANPRRQRHAR